MEEGRGSCDMVQAVGAFPMIKLEVVCSTSDTPG